MQKLLKAVFAIESKRHGTDERKLKAGEFKCKSSMKNGVNFRKVFKTP